jgi:hypothetical protein
MKVVEHAAFINLRATTTVEENRRHATNNDVNFAGWPVLWKSLRSGTNLDSDSANRPIWSWGHLDSLTNSLGKCC